MFSWRICLHVFRFVSFRFKAKENLQRSWDVFFDILIQQARELGSRYVLMFK